MIAKHLCVHDKFRSFYPKDEHFVTTYYKEYPAASILQDGLDSTHYIVVELIPDELVDNIYVKPNIVQL